MSNGSQPIGLIDRQILEGISNGETLPTIAARLGMSRVTVWRRTQRAPLAAALEELQRQATVAAERTLRTGAERAARTVVDLLDAPEPAVRLRAAVELLDRVMPADGAVDATELEDGRLLVNGKRYRPEGEEACDSES